MLTAAGADVFSDDGRVTVRFGFNAVAVPTLVTIQQLAPSEVPAGSFPPGVAYAIHLSPPDGITNALVTYRFSSAELRAAQPNLTDDDGGLLSYLSPGDAGFPGAHSGLGFHIPHLMAFSPDGGVTFATGDSVSSSDEDGAGSITGTFGEPMEAFTVRLSPIRIGYATTLLDCCSESPWPINLAVGAPPATYHFYVQTPSSGSRYYIDEVRDAFDLTPPGFATVTPGRYQLDIVAVPEGDMKYDSFSLACNAEGTGYVKFQTQGEWQLGAPPGAGNQIEHATLIAPFHCLPAGSTGDAGVPSSGGFTGVVHGQGLITPAGADLVSSDGRLVVYVPPGAVDCATTVAITRSATALPMSQPSGVAYDVTAAPNGGPIFVTFSERLSEAEVRAAEATAVDADGGPWRYISPGDGGFPGQGASVHVGNPVGGDVLGPLYGPGTTVLRQDPEGGLTFHGSVALPASQLSVRLSPLRIGLSATSGKGESSPWPIALHAGAAAAPYYFYWQNAAGGVEYTQAFGDVSLDAVSQSADFATLSTGFDEFDPLGGFSTVGPGVTRRRQYLLACTAPGSGALVISTSGGVTPFSEADWDFVDLTVPFTCLDL